MFEIGAIIHFETAGQVSVGPGMGTVPWVSSFPFRSSDEGLKYHESLSCFRAGNTIGRRIRRQEMRTSQP
jgi:hypothetical protein